MGQVKHGKSYCNIYKVWTSMLSRCRNPNHHQYKNYGARGINICKNWNEFENFYLDMGDPPFSKAQLDRIDNNLGYFKENCRWVTAKKNSRNKRTNRSINTHKGRIIKSELIEQIGWTKHQFRWFEKKYGIKWILKNFKDNTLPKKTNSPINREDLVGKMFGKWSVLAFHSYDRKTGHLYLCQCSCLSEKLIPRDNLLKLKSHQCRKCSAKESWLKKKTKMKAIPPTSSSTPAF